MSDGVEDLDDREKHSFVCAFDVVFILVFILGILQRCALLSLDCAAERADEAETNHNKSHLLCNHVAHLRIVRQWGPLRQTDSI